MPTSESKPIPLRALVISVAAMAIPLFAGFVAPEWMTDQAGVLVWLTALVPAFLLSYYKGWRGASVALALGMAVLTSAHVALLLLGGPEPNWTLLLGVVIVYIGVSLGLGTFAAVSEGCVFAAKAGGNPEALLKAFAGGAANSWMVQNLAPKVFERDFEPGFMIDLAQKDLRLVQDAAAERDVPLFTTPIVSQLYRAAQGAGFGREGIQAYVKVLEKLAGTEARANPQG